MELLGPMLKRFAAAGCCICGDVPPNWKAFGVAGLNENGACAAGAVAGPPKLNGFAASAGLLFALNENEPEPFK